jgi:hypothetical protein
MEWSEVIFPRRWTVAGVRLQPLCIGHALLLERMRSAFAWSDNGRAAGGDQAGPGDLHAALWICSRPWQEARDGIRSRRMRWWMAVRAWRHAWRPERFDVELLSFAAYVRLAWDRPAVRVEVKSEGKASGVPECLRLVRTLMSHYGMTLEAALSTPVLLASWMTLAWWDEEGTLRFESAQDRAFAAHVARIEAELEQEAAHA